VDGVTVGWRLAIRHVTSHDYETEVLASYNEARVTPAALPEQLCLETSVTIEPACRQFRYRDYWGTLVTAFDVAVPHRRLRVTASSLVETTAAPTPPSPVSWTELAQPARVDELAEFLTPTTYAPIDERVSVVVDGLRSLGSPWAAARAGVDWVGEQMVYEPGVTDVRSSALEALAHGRGVCQDFAHLSLVVLRAAGIPARYVSGYLHPAPDAAVGARVDGQGHAWVEWWCGRWYGWDPTHGIPAGERHVIVARGRDYADVAPLKGVYHGGRASAHVVAVELTRLS
jgi:transglutaminase-like putative cysteine protease